MNRRTAIVFLSLVLALLPAACRRSADSSPLAVAASNSLLACAARDLLGQSTPVLALAEPGMCPGHFDMRPSQIDALRRCRLLLRMDFQESLDAKLSAAIDRGLLVAQIRIAGGLCEPESYLTACQQTADALVAAGLLDRTAAEDRLGEIAARIGRLASRCRQRAAAWKDKPVLASAHQEAFCRWLGLNVVATFGAADTAGARQINQAIRLSSEAGVGLVVANLPEGRRVADALAERLGAKVVVFDNFPALNSGQSSFDDLLEANIHALAEATGA
jgi:zinc transport system substrate-binding protein